MHTKVRFLLGNIYYVSITSDTKMISAFSMFGIGDISKVFRLVRSNINSSSKAFMFVLP